jgi:hypothetical protein
VKDSIEIMSSHFHAFSLQPPLPRAKKRKFITNLCKQKKFHLSLVLYVAKNDGEKKEMKIGKKFSYEAENCVKEAEQ